MFTFFHVVYGRIFARRARKNRAVKRFRVPVLQFLSFTSGKASGISTPIPCARKLRLRPKNGMDAIFGHVYHSRPRGAPARLKPGSHLAGINTVALRRAGVTFFP